MKPRLFCILFLFVFFQQSFPQTNNVFQYSVITALMEGNFDGDLSIAELSKQGDFGLGTLNKLDGELIILDGEYYQVTSEGKVNLVPDESLTPFAVITFFKSNETINQQKLLSLNELNLLIDEKISSPNLIYAIKVEGEFQFVKTRSVPAQEKPYKKLIDVTKNQSVFEFENIEGTMIGFRFPSFSDGINVPGYHFHFLSTDKKSGGHVLEIQTDNIKIELARMDNLNLSFPMNEDFLKSELLKANQAELNQAEK